MAALYGLDLSLSRLSATTGLYITFIVTLIKGLNPWLLQSKE